MFSHSTLLATLTLALVVVANPVITVRDAPVRLSMVKRMNFTGITTLLESDRARVRGLKARANAKINGLRMEDVQVDAIVGSVPATNGLVDYTVNVGIGTPPTTYTLIVDTGSSNTWVGADPNKPYVKTSSSVQTPDSVAVQYGSGSFSGTEFTDTVTLGSGLTINQQSIGAASQAQGFQGVDGLIGVGPVDLTTQTLSPDTGSAIPTVTDNLFTQGTIAQHLLAISFEPATSVSSVNGELTFGGTDSSKFTGGITFTPLTQTSPANQFWGIDQSITYGTASKPILAATAGIVDTGTTLLLIASDAFAAYKKATGAILDNTTGLLRLTETQFKNVQSLFFNIGGQSFEFTANAQAFPRALNSQIGGNSLSVYLIISDIGTPSGQGLDFINGMAFLERFYSVFDTAGQRVGIANTPFTTATTN